MSIENCAKCGKRIDTDDDVECTDEYGLIICESCSEKENRDASHQEPSDARRS
jgi:hypothetical protein